MHVGASAVAGIDGRLLVGEGAPVGVPFDREDAPQLAREIDQLCDGLKCARPQQIVFTAEFALRSHAASVGFLRGRRWTLAIGWPLMQVLDADELRAALGLALLGETVTLGISALAAHDARVAERVGAPLLARTLTRLLAAEVIGAEQWWSDWTARMRREPTAPPSAFGELRGRMEAFGRGGWQDALMRARQAATDLTRIEALGAVDLGGGSHRCAAAALLWEGLVNRVWTALEPAFAELLAPIWTSGFNAAAAARARIRELAALRTAGSIEAAQQIELAALVELVGGARAAHPLYREAYARQRSPQLALALARTLLAVDPPRARNALVRLAASTPELAAEAQRLLALLPTCAPSSPSTTQRMP